MAQNTLEIIIKANSSKAISEIKKLDTTIGKVSSTSAKDFDLIKSKWAALDAKLSSPGGWKIMAGAAGAAVGVLTTVGIAMKGLADDFMNYAFRVEDFVRKIGATPEEASKLIQVAGDVRLSVETMTVAMKTAISKGYNPNIEGLKKLSDEYLAIQNPIDRTRFAMEVFGTRAGPEMAKLLELGSDAIDKMGKSIENTGLLMTQEGIDKARAYYTAIDNLGDAAQSASLSIGGELVPVITSLTNGLSSIAGDAVGVIQMFIAMQRAMEGDAANLWDVQAALVDYFLNTKKAADITQEFADKALAAQLATQGLAGPMFDLNSGYLGLSSTAATAANNSNEANLDFHSCGGNGPLFLAAFAAAFISFLVYYPGSCAIPIRERPPIRPPGPLPDS